MSRTIRIKSSVIFAFRYGNGDNKGICHNTNKSSNKTSSNNSTLCKESAIDGPEEGKRLIKITLYTSRKSDAVYVCVILFFYFFRM